MPKLIVQNLGNCHIPVVSGQKLLEAIQAQGYDWMHACGGKGRCTSCRVVVVAGLASFGALTDAEIRYRNNGRLLHNERLTCQCTLLHGDATGKVPEQTKLPHMHYTS